MLPGVGFFGCGPLAQVVIGNLQDQGFTIKAIWAPKHEDAQRISKTLNIPFYSTVIDKVLLMPTVQLVVTACAPHFHNQIASKACGIGKHVVCDWPPSHCIKESILMRNAATNYPSLITLFLNGLRFVPTFNLMKKLIQEDQILGDIRLINASVMCDVVSICEEKSIYWDHHMGGGLLSLYGTNLIDILTYITGYRAQRVHGIIHCVKQLHQNPILFNPTEDFVNFQMELLPSKGSKLLTGKKDGPLIVNVVLNGHHYHTQPKHEIHIYGTNGYLVSRDGDIYTYQNADHQNEPTTVVNHHDDHEQSARTDVERPKSQEKLFYTLNEREYQWRASPSSKLLHDSYVYPKIYLTGIRNMIQALKNAFQSPQQHKAKLDDFKTKKTIFNLSQTMMNGGDQINNNHIKVANNRIQHHQQQQQPAEEEQLIHWIKDPVLQATNFDDGIYLQTVVDAIRMSSQVHEWIRIHIETDQR